jgi:hypothetical protein
MYDAREKIEKKIRFWRGKRENVGHESTDDHVCAESDFLFPPIQHRPIPFDGSNIRCIQREWWRRARIRNKRLYTTLYASVTLHTLVVYTVYTEEWHNLASVCCKKRNPHDGCPEYIGEKKEIEWLPRTRDSPRAAGPEKSLKTSSIKPFGRWR